jgi:hypothetical protein
MLHNTITGTIAGLRDCGTLVVLFLDTADGRVAPVPMDHQAYRHLLDAAARAPGDLIGRTVSFDGTVVVFVD